MVIKRIALAPAGERGADFCRAWREAAAGRLAAPSRVRPLRVTLATALPEFSAGAAHAGVGIEWFADAEHLARLDRWMSDGPPAAPGRAIAPELPAGTLVVVAAEHVVRGADWLRERWARGDTCSKHMALARRAAGLTPEEFSRRWRGHAGTVGAIPIPESARGLAYVQNHPLPRAAGEWAYDAVNEVYVAGAAGLRRRIEWFADNLPGNDPDDLVRESAFLAVREAVL